MPKVKATISLDIEHIVWLDKEIEKGTFVNRREGIQCCIDQKMRKSSAPEPLEYGRICDE